MARLSGKRKRNCLAWAAGALILAGCQAFSGGDSFATIDAELTIIRSESESIRASATAERSMAINTVAAASTRVAELSAINAALGATLRANYTDTPEVREVVVSAEDMGSSMDDAKLDDAAQPDLLAGDMLVSNLATAAETNISSGCSSGLVSQFSPTAQRIYITAQVSALQAGTVFSVDWLRQNEALYSLSWQAEESKPFECIWFYVTPSDFAFAPGEYQAIMYADGLELGGAAFSILDG